MLWVRWKGAIVDYLMYKKRQQEKENILQLIVRNKNWCKMKVSAFIQTYLCVVVAVVSFGFNKFVFQFVLMLLTLLERARHDFF